MHLEALNSEAHKIFSQLKNFPNFYLVGGTALALQIGHRISVDFDLFFDKRIPKNLIKKIKDVFPRSEVDVLVNRSDDLTVLLNKIKLTFFNYPFPVVRKLINFEGVKILSIVEIAATKAYALGQRATYKDYIDLYFILSEKHCSLEQIIDLAQKKYKSVFDAKLFLEQLVYLEDVEDVDIQFLKQPIHKKQLQKFFEQEIKKIIL